MNVAAFRAFAPVGAPPPGWEQANDDALALGLGWIAARLNGGEGAEQRAAWRAARAAMAQAGAPAALDRVSQAFGLSAFDEDALMIALAPQIDGGFGPAYAAVLDRAAPAPASPRLLARLLFGAERLPFEAAERLGPDAPLIGFALLERARSGLAVEAALWVPDAVRDRLCGLAAREAALEERVFPLDAAAPLTWSLANHAARFVALPDAPLRLHLVGPRRSGRRALAAAVLQSRGYPALELRPLAALAPSFDALRREATLEGAGLVLDLDGAGPVEIELARMLARRFSGPIVALAAEPVEPFDNWPGARLAPVEPAERAMLWRRALPELPEDDIAAVSEQFALGPSEIEALAARPGILAHGVWRACRERGAPPLSALATRIAPRRGFDEMVLHETTRADLEALAAQVSGRARVLGDWGYRGLLGAATGVSALFAGASGVGKTMAAEALAGALGLDLYVVDLSRVTSKYIGETEKNLAQVFEAAEAGGSALFFDEADALFGKRSDVKDSHDRYANGEISYLLQRMERFGGLAILASNLKSNLDGAFLRRLRMIVDFPMPDVRLRLALWRRALPSSAPLGEIDFTALARLELSGAAITTVAANAAFRAAASETRIEMAHLRAALAAEFRKLDRDPSELGAL